MKTPRTDSAADVEAPPANPRQVEILDEAGQPLGYTFTVKDEIPEPADLEPNQTREVANLHHLAKSLAGWSSFYVDGEKYLFSQARAVALFTRFPHIAAQVERAIKS